MSAIYDKSVLGCDDVCFGTNAPFQRDVHLQGVNFNLGHGTLFSSIMPQQTAVLGNTTTN